MTIGQREQHRNVSRQRRFIISEKQKKKLHEASQKRLLQISDVQLELEKKQWSTDARQTRVVVQEWSGLPTEQNSKSQTKCRRRKRIVEDRSYVNERRNLDKGHIKKRESADGGTDRLLMLAQSVELLLESEDNLHGTDRNDHSNEGSQINPTAPQLQNQLVNSKSADQKYIEKQLDAMQMGANVEAERNALSQGRTCVSQFWHKAQVQNHQLAQEEMPGNVDCQICEDIQIEGVVANQDQEAIGFQDDAHLEGVATIPYQGAIGCQDALVANCDSQKVEVMHEYQRPEELGHQCLAENGKVVTAKSMQEDQECHRMDHQCIEAQGCEQIEQRRKHSCLAETELPQVSEEKGQPTIKHCISTHQLMQKNIEFEELKEWRHKARILRLLRTNKRRKKLRKHARHPQEEQLHALIKDRMAQACDIEPQYMVQMLEMQKKDQMGQACDIEPQCMVQMLEMQKEDQMGQACDMEPHCRVQMLEMQKDHRYMARQRRLLRTFERRKLRRKHFSAAKIQADERRMQMWKADEQSLWQMSHVWNEPLIIYDLQQSGHPSMTPQRRRAIWRKSLNNCQQNDENRVDGGTHMVDMDIRAEPDKLLAEVGHDFDQPVIDNVLKIKVWS